MKGKAPNVTIVMAPAHPLLLPDSPYSLWVQGELEELMRLPDDGTTVEIIGGEIVVSRAPELGHNHIIKSIVRAFEAASLRDLGHSWEWSLGNGVDLTVIEDGYIPDLLIHDAQLYRDALGSGVRMLVSDHLEMAIEVTSPSNADSDRRPGPAAGRKTKWSGYARSEVPYYLLVDRDPKAACSILYSIPDESTGAYLQEESWPFGEPIVLPEHFGLTIPTAEWTPWATR